MASYKQIQLHVKQKFGFVPKTCWIAHVKELSGIPTRRAPNRIDNSGRVEPCPLERQAAIIEALRHFGILLG